ncbi:hypothetical protein B0H17DRAFT_1149852 [Mycena rosella]|uniref:Hydrophobin n=1 Tax=Mycena rosella TaxID=1033263 RepID=A0AAD7BYE5_MYCRO|nr:hypothetical protein B0H17DRAFT_1149852 [Mycena rosella]
MFLRTSSVIAALLVPLVFATPYPELRARSVQVCCLPNTSTSGPWYDRVVEELETNHYTVPPGPPSLNLVSAIPIPGTHVFTGIDGVMTCVHSTTGFDPFMCDDLRGIPGPIVIYCGINCVETK